MATYNGARHLPEQLQSLMDQDRRPDELVICDDCSSDGTVQILEQFAQRASFPVRVERNVTNLGYAQNFSKALSLCQGGLIFLSDQDDVWFRNKISTIVDHAVRLPEILVFMNDVALTDSDLKPAGITKLQQFRAGAIPLRYFVMGCCSAIRRQLLELCLPIPATYPAHDEWIIRFADGLDSRFIVEEVLQYYRRHGENTSDFVANSLSPLSPLTQSRRDVRLLASSDRRRQFARQLEREEMIAEGARRAESRCAGAASRALRNFRAQTERRVALLRARQSLQTKPLPLRLIHAFALLARGDYGAAASGVKSFVRDIVA